MWLHIDNSTMDGQLREVIIEIVFWHIYFVACRKFISFYVINHSFFKYCHGRPTMTSRPDIFRSSMLANMAYDMQDFIKYLHQYFTGWFTNAAHFWRRTQTLLSHHFATASTTFAFMNLFGDDPYFQNMLFSLVALTPIWLVIRIVWQTRDINHLNGRAQLAVFGFIDLEILILSRFVWWPFTLHAFLVNSVAVTDVWWIYVVAIAGSLSMAIYNVVAFRRTALALYKCMFV
eukprot:947987_1